MADTSGFYKLEDEQVLFAPGNVYGPGWTLLRSEYDRYTYPYNDWYWFDTIRQAYTFFDYTPSINETYRQDSDPTIVDREARIRDFIESANTSTIDRVWSTFSLEDKQDILLQPTVFIKIGL